MDRCVTGVYNALGYLLLGLRVESVESGELRVPDLNAEPKLFSRSLIKDLGRGPIDFTYDLYVQYLAEKRGWPIFEFDVGYEARAWGKSKLAANPWAKLKQSANAFYRMMQMRVGVWS